MISSVGRFRGKSAVVTGASRGIGKTIAFALANEGCDVVVSYEKQAHLAEEVATAIRKMNVRALALECDVSKRNEVELLFKNTIDEFGKLDILVNNAGIFLGASLMQTTEELWNRTLSVNLTGVLLCTQTAARQMMKRKEGSIVNISSNSGLGIAVGGEAAYAVSKAAVVQLTKTAAFELGEFGINVNCVAPGAIETDMLRRNMTDEEYSELIASKKKLSSRGLIGKPEDVANAVLFFADEKSRFITGKTLLVDGGRRDFL